MLSMYVEKHAQDWDRLLPYYAIMHIQSLLRNRLMKVHFTCCKYGRDAHQPIAKGLDCNLVDLDKYKSDLYEFCLAPGRLHPSELSQPRSIRNCVCQDHNHWQLSTMWQHMPHDTTGKAAKLARPFFGPYHITSITSTNADSEVRLIDKPDDPAIFVSLSHVRPCYSELPNSSGADITRLIRRRKLAGVELPAS